MRSEMGLKMGLGRKDWPNWEGGINPIGREEFGSGKRTVRIRNETSSSAKRLAGVIGRKRAHIANVRGPIVCERR